MLELILYPPGERNLEGMSIGGKYALLENGRPELLFNDLSEYQDWLDCMSDIGLPRSLNMPNNQYAIEAIADHNTEAQND